MWRAAYAGIAVVAILVSPLVFIGLLLAIPLCLLAELLWLLVCYVSRYTTCSMPGALLSVRDPMLELPSLILIASFMASDAKVGVVGSRGRALNSGPWLRRRELSYVSFSRATL